MLWAAGGNPRPPALSDNPDSDSTILKFLKFLTELLDQAIPYSVAIIEVWLDKTFV